MLMCKEMILTILVIPLTLGTEPEIQRRVIKFCPAADRTLVLRTARIPRWLSHLGFELLPPVHLMGRIAFEIPGGQEKDDKVEQGHKNRYLSCPAALKKLQHCQDSIYDRHPFHFYRDDEHQEHLHLRVREGER